MASRETGTKQAARASHGRFSSGVSGNPAGRPRGSRNRVTQLCSELLAADAEAVFARLIKEAKRGEPLAMRLVVERLVPIRAARDRVVEVDLPDVGRAVDLVEAAAALVNHAASGEITLSEAKEFMGLLEGERKLMETADLAVRLEALEGARRSDQVAGELERMAPDLRARVRFLEPDEKGGEGGR